MNFIGMGPMEIGVILIVALIIFGPGKLPEVAGQVGKAVRDFRRMTSDLTDEFEKTSGVKDIKRTIQDEMSGVKSQLTGATDGVKRDLNSAAKNVNTKVSSAASSAGRKSTSAKSTTSSSKTASTTAAKASASSKKSGASSKAAAKAPPVATKADPLADVSFFEEAALVSSNGVNGASSTRADAESSESERPDRVVISDGASDHSADDALSRARRRRQTAGYNRTST